MDEKIKVVGIYTADDPQHLPIRPLYVRDQCIFLKGAIDEGEFWRLALNKVDRKGNGLYEARVLFSAWDDGGSSKNIFQQIITPFNDYSEGSDTPQSDNGERFHIFDPNYVMMHHNMPRAMLDKDTNEGGYLWKVARSNGADAIVAACEEVKGIEKPELLETTYNGFVRLPEPIVPGYGINHKVDTQVGCLDFTVNLRV